MISTKSPSFIGSESPWHGYFSSLPEVGVDLALFWGLNGGRDGVEAREWLKGTEAEKILSPPRGQHLLVRDVILTSRLWLTNT